MQTQKTSIEQVILDQLPATTIELYRGNDPTHNGFVKSALESMRRNGRIELDTSSRWRLNQNGPEAISRITRALTARVDGPISGVVTVIPKNTPSGARHSGVLLRWNSENGAATEFFGGAQSSTDVAERMEAELR